MNEEELREELEGSRLDVQAACTRVSVRYLPHDASHPAPAWMSQHPVQAIITCHIAPSAAPPPPPSPPAPPAAASSASHSPSAPGSVPQLIHVAACMPSGYALLHRDGEQGQPETEHESDTAAGSDSRWRFAAPLSFFPSLNSLLQAHSADYTANKEAELTRKLQAVVAAQEEEDDDRPAEAGSTAAALQTG